MVSDVGGEHCYSTSMWWMTWRASVHYVVDEAAGKHRYTMRWTTWRAPVHYAYCSAPGAHQLGGGVLRLRQPAPKRINLSVGFTHSARTALVNPLSQNARRKQ